MNLIEKQAVDFYLLNWDRTDDYKDFIKELKRELDEYAKISHKLDFIDNLRNKLKESYDEHLKTCQYPNDPLKCRFNSDFENTLFFSQNVKEKLIQNLDQVDFSLQERRAVDQKLSSILNDVNELKLGQQISYDDFYDEFQELKELYYLNKKNWKQLMIGKLSEMVAGGIISETISKGIIEGISRTYS